MSAGSFTPIGASGFSGVQLTVSVGSHGLAGPLPFGVFVYGFDDFDSYGYPGGMSLAPIARVTEITLAPETGLNLVGTEHCLTATVVDQDGNPLEGIRVDFTVSGPNATTGFATTDANGQATFCYTGTSVGDVASNTAAKTWFDNQPPVALCADVTISASPLSCLADASVDIGSFDPDGDPIAIVQAPAGPYGLGMTTVTLTVTDPSGASDSCTAVVTVNDDTPPELQCVESVNPSLKNVPKASKTNEDGFYQVIATEDGCSASTITIGSFTLANNETIKITQRPGKAGVTLANTMGKGGIKHFLVGPGDAVITATDASGNATSASCLVPPPPK